MDYKEELKKLMEIVKASAKASGERMTNEEIANRLGYERPYLSQLIGAKGVVTEAHILVFKAKFKAELEAADIPMPKDPMNPERALVLAMLDDYATWKAKKEGVSYKSIQDGIKKKASLILNGLESWLPE